MEGTPPHKIHPAQLDDVPSALALLVEHRDDPRALDAAVRLVDALEDQMERCPRSEWPSWAAAAEAAEEALRRCWAAHVRRLGVDALGEAGEPPAREVPELVTKQARGPRGARCRPGPPECDDRRRRRRSP